MRINSDMRYSLILVFLALMACTARPTPSSTKPETHFKKTNPLSLTGDFDGDGRTDTLIQQLIFMRDNHLVDSVPDPYQEEYDSIVKYYVQKDIMVTLTLSSKPTDTIQFSPAMGTYCLINLGDNNHDGKEEIALVPDLPDYSNLNSCHIYSLYEQHWVELKQFSINEDSFISNDSTYKTIPGYLEKRNGKWEYQDSAETFKPLGLPI